MKDFTDHVCDIQFLLTLALYYSFISPEYFVNYNCVYPIKKGRRHFPGSLSDDVNYG